MWGHYALKLRRSGSARFSWWSSLARCSELDEGSRDGKSDGKATTRKLGRSRADRNEMENEIAAADAR